MADQNNQKLPANAKLRFRYIKSYGFRTVKVDGAIGGFTPRGEIFMSLYTERPQIPDEQEYDVTEAGSLKLSQDVIEKQGVIREVALSAVMRPEIAVALRNWFDERIKEFESETGLTFKTDSAGGVKVVKTKLE